MIDRNQSADVVDQLVEQLSNASQRLAQATEDQARQLEQRTKDLVDRAEAATERVVDTIDRELRAQLGELRRDIERLVARVGEIAKRAPAKKAPAKKKSAAKKAVSQEDRRRRRHVAKIMPWPRMPSSRRRRPRRRPQRRSRHPGRPRESGRAERSGLLQGSTRPRRVRHAGCARTRCSDRSPAHCHATATAAVPVFRVVRPPGLEPGT